MAKKTLMIAARVGAEEVVTLPHVRTDRPRLDGEELHAVVVGLQYRSDGDGPAEAPSTSDDDGDADCPVDVIGRIVVRVIPTSTRLPNARRGSGRREHHPSDQLPDRLALGEDPDRAAREVMELGPVIDPQVPVDRRQQVLRRQRRLHLIVWCSDRIRASLSPSLAWSGKSSQRSRPGTVDGMGRNGPRYSLGASGLGS